MNKEAVLAVCGWNYLKKLALIHSEIIDMALTALPV
jgi:hypothetical protein